MDSLTLGTFQQCMQELMIHYNKSLTALAQAGFYEYLKSELTDKKLLKATAKAMAVEKFFPTAVRLTELAIDERPPGENYIGSTKVDYLALPSTEINLANLTPEQMQANLDKMRGMLKQSSERYKRRAQWTRTSDVLEAEKYTEQKRVEKKAKVVAESTDDELVLKELQTYLLIYSKTLNSALLDSVSARIAAEPDKFELVRNHLGQPINVKLKDIPF